MQRPFSFMGPISGSFDFFMLERRMFALNEGRVGDTGGYGVCRAGIGRW
jgi:hypothetical protein